MGAALPVRIVAVLFQEGRRRQHGVGVDGQVVRGDVDHDLVGDVLERSAGQFSVGEIAHRIDSCQEQHVDLAFCRRLDDGSGVPARRRRQQSAPGHFDGRPFSLVVHQPAAREERGMQAPSKGATIVGPAAQQCELRPDFLGGRARRRDGSGNLEEARACKDDGVGSGLSHHCAGVAHLHRRLAPRQALSSDSLFTRRAEEMFGDIR